MKINGKHYYPKDPAKVVKVEHWYSPSLRSWVVQSKDAAGNQVGEATYVARHAHAITERISREKEAKIPAVLNGKDNNMGAK